MIDHPAQPVSSQAFSELSAEVYERDWRPVHDGIFSGRYALEGPFRDTTWEVALLPLSHFIEETDFEALEAMAGEAGDTAMVVKDAEIISPPEPARLVQVKFEALEALMKKTILSHFEDHLFGRSATWGAVFAVEHFTVIAAQPRLIEVLTARLGGRERLKERFLEFCPGVLSTRTRHDALRLTDWARG